MAEEKFHRLFETMTELVVINEMVYTESGVAVDYRITNCNSSFLRETGQRLEDIIGHMGSEIYGSDPPPYLAECAEVVRTRIPYQFTHYFETLDKYLSVSVISPVTDKFAMVGTDITDLQRTRETLVKKNRELENYIHIASHDLRSPLVNIQGFSARLRTQSLAIRDLVQSSSMPAVEAEKLRAILEEGMPKTLDFIVTNVVIMDRLITALAVLSRTERRAMTIRQIDMNALFKGILDAFAFDIEQSAAVVTVSDLADCYGDEYLLHELFLNLIGNALKYREPARTPEIQIRSELLPRGVVYRVSDNGIGIAKKNHEHIWDSFYRVNRDTQVPGEGIGLSIVKRIIDKHRGKIWLESEEGRGSTFYVELPAAPFTADE